MAVISDVTQWIKANTLCSEEVLWTNDACNMFRRDPPTVRYEDIMSSDKGVALWTSLIRCYGFCYVDGCPISPSATQELLERIAFIRLTHYETGGFWDFTSDLAHKDTAYTTLSLSAHTDTTYFTDPCGLQLFHLLSHTDGAGGASLLVDGFAAAAALRKQDPQAYVTLSKPLVPTHASGNEGMNIRPARPSAVFTHEFGTKKLLQVRWNNDDRDVMDRWEGINAMDKWYDAANKWTALLRRKEMEYWAQLKPGKPISKRDGDLEGLAVGGIYLLIWYSLRQLEDPTWTIFVHGQEKDVWWIQ
ncbi:MAG: hypothetical protein M1827_002827 [Pycnora praestabilis]|nr:MAG: hypothetical protein M1827_002827 [Pycnora praestabilis]